MIKELNKINHREVSEALKQGARLIAPLWPLENFVAVNPYLNIAHLKFCEAMDLLAKAGNVQATLPIGFYLNAIREGNLLRDDINHSLGRNQFGITIDVDSFMGELYTSTKWDQDPKIRTFVDVASEINGKKWRRFMIDRISFWASAYFDQKQATWNTAKQDRSLYKSWKMEAEVDHGPGAMGLRGFRNFVRSFPEDHLEAAAKALQLLQVPDQLLPYYLGSLLLKMNGWAGFAARLDWEAALESRKSNALEEFLSILLVWEVALKELLGYDNLDQSWEVAKLESKVAIDKKGISKSLAYKLILQDAFDRANQRRIIAKINGQPPREIASRSKDVQAVFCIDVRSELYRRNLEAVNTRIETLGFAGFFAFPIKYIPLAHEQGTNQCPVLLTPSHTIREGFKSESDEQKAVASRTLQAQVTKTWKSFKQSAIGCFGFVSPLGLFFLPKLLSNALNITKPASQPDRFGLNKKQTYQKSVRLNPEMWRSELTGIPLEDRKKMAASALNAMSLTDHFAPIVLIVGHGASTTNNPHATGLDCGACGGHTGEANAKVAVAVLNDPEVRLSLRESGIDIPHETVFIAALHDTTQDNVTLFNLDHSSDRINPRLLQELNYSLSMAGINARKERASRMNIDGVDVQKKVLLRSKDWSQVRPEWGLAGCSSFIVAPRERTSQLDFGGKAFMHNYSWQKDKDFGVLELIMTAPMVVTSWINLQYYASTVDNRRFGSGNKTLHNVVGGVGVLEGFAGDLRVGLPFQSVNDGENYQHEPQRLNVIVEAPVDEMSKILQKHESVRNLCDNEWIYLFAMNGEGKVTYKYIGGLQWEIID